MIERIFTYKIFPEKKLILKYYSGLFAINDFKKSIQTAAQDKLYDPSYNVINDLTDAEVNFEESGIVDFITFIKSNKRFYQSRNSAFITKKPNETVFTILLQALNDENKIRIETFSTLQGTKHWLRISDADIEEIEKSFDLLRLQSSVL